MRLQIGAMSAGDILDRGLKLLLSRLPTFYAINLLAFSPVILAQLLFPNLWVPGFRPEDQLRLLGSVLLLGGAAATLQPIVGAATVYVVARAFTDEPGGVGGAFAFALRRFFPLLAASLLFGMVFMAGSALCCVPGILFAIWFIFVGQVVAVERRRPLAALGRSMELTEGYRWRILGLVVLFAVGYWLLGALANAFAVIWPQFEPVPSDRGVDIVVNYRNYYMALVVRTLSNILLQTFAAVCLTLLYLDLRIRKEGLDLELATRRQASLV